jgi:hypothetical protein
MKANEAPKKIYLQVCGDCPQTDCESCKFEDFEDNITWCRNKIFEEDIEYTRTNAFIEKAVSYLEGTLFNEVCYGEIRPDIVQAYIDNFKKAMYDVF